MAECVVIGCICGSRATCTIVQCDRMQVALLPNVPSEYRINSFETSLTHTVISKYIRRHGDVCACASIQYDVFPV